MLGSEGELGPWHMPEAEPDMEQKNQDNIQMVANTLAFLRTYKDLHEGNPKGVIVFTSTKDGEEKKLLVKETVIATWEGALTGAMNEMHDEGMHDDVEILLAMDEAKGEGDAGEE